jgi:hypothetical protein
MPEKGEKRAADLSAFLDAAGSSLSEAQEKLGAGLDIPTGMLLSEVELELKAAVRSDEKGRLIVETFSAQEISQGGIDPGLLSSFQIHFIAAAAEPVKVPEKISPPKRNPDQVIDLIRGRADLVALEKILGGLKYTPTYIPDNHRWLVIIQDPNDSIVREVVLPDE